MAYHDGFYFPFYTKEFIVSTVGMAPEQVGVYVRFMCYQFDNGPLPIDDKEELERIAGTKNIQKIVKKFPKGINPKLAEIIDDMKRKSEIRAKSVSKRYQETYKTPTNSLQNDYKSPTKNLQISHSNINSDSESNINTNKESKVEREGALKGRFAPPSLPEIVDYCNSEGFVMDPKMFFDHFTSNGWKVGGKAPMKDWRAAVRNWERREKSRTKDKSHETHQKAQAFVAKMQAMGVK